MSANTNTALSAETEVANLLSNMYGGYLAGDPSIIDGLLAPEFTMFDSASHDLIVGHGDLAAVRAARGPVNPNQRETDLVVHDLRVFARGEHLIACFILEVKFEDAAGTPLASERARNTALFTRIDGDLRLTHIHEDVWQQGGTAQA
ncbi:nuclear transport factor 2 family protein [Lysinibacter cavernae]|uniref:Ketosteroid isomerase-like protein n=1 Tax=Lysinibacter cavernae TaxID=1640652 RepID=A0A7X5TRR8_9MICO|nr:nuclear transport factor 2 family protein [Lysinibacter cavernae]NIH52581.1 ketosteroid isomerase-like protein [Lysinibacter cavernae]